MALPEEQMAAIDNIAAKQMGVAPATPPQQTQAAPAERPDTPQEAASKELSPTTEGDNVLAESTTFTVDFGDGNMRSLTDKQIVGTYNRYRDLNHKQAQYKPVNDLVDKIMKANPNMTPTQVAETLDNIVRAGKSNPTMGNVKGEKSGDSQSKQAPAGQNPQPEMDEMLASWEKENAATLPPGYKEMLVGQGQSNQALQAQIQQVQAQLQQVLAQSQGVAQAARDGVVNANTQKVDAVKQTIANNLNRAQASLQLADDKVNDFLIFTAERGYSLEDFVDGQLTSKVMTDFKNMMDSEEMDRYREMSQRRQAYTGSLGSSPSSQQGAAEPTGDSTFDKLSSGIMSQKGIG
tara:strand:+ start:4054 stop:5100 length:1047 start_codon:yes stop_codon:yes gene_type:complete